jgi:hypothetical protein
MPNRKRVGSDAELIESKKWGVPSWKDNKGYPKNWQTLRPDQQKWEFLRRTKDYRYDWERAESAVPPKIKAASKFHIVHPFNEKALTAKYYMSHPVPPQSDYKNLPKGFHFIRRTSAGGHVVYPRCAVPNQPESKKVPQSEQEEKLASYAYEISMPDIPMDWYEMRVWVEFDLGSGVDEQIKIAKQNLIDAGRKVKAFMRTLENPEGKYTPDDYAPLIVRARKERITNKEAQQSIDEAPPISLLRIFDAKNCGRNNTQIKHGLFACTGESIDTSTVSKRHKVAVRLWKRL